MPMVILVRTNDSVQADLLEAALRAHGVQCRRNGVANPALIGGGPSIFDQTVEVPLDEEHRAKEILSTLVTSHTAPAVPIDSSSWAQTRILRRLAPALVRAWLFGFIGLWLSIPAKQLARWARARGVPSAGIIGTQHLFVLFLAVGIVVALTFSAEHRYKAAALAALLVALASLFLVGP